MAVLSAQNCIHIQEKIGAKIAELGLDDVVSEFLGHIYEVPHCSRVWTASFRVGAHEPYACSCVRILLRLLRLHSLN